MWLFRRATIAQKLIVVFTVLSLVWCSINAFSVYVAYDMKRLYTYLFDHQTEALVHSKEIQYHVSMQSYALAAYLVSTGAGALDDQKSIAALESANQAVNVLVEATLPVLQEESDIEQFKGIKLHNEQFMEKAMQVILLAKDNRVKAEIMMQTEVNNLSKVMISEVEKVAHSQSLLMQLEMTANNESLSRLSEIILWIAVIALVGSLLLSYVFSRSMSKPLLQLVKHTEQIAAGNLKGNDLVTNAQDEIGQLMIHFKKMTLQLNQIVEKIVGSTHTIGHAIDRWKDNTEMNIEANRSIAKVIQEVQISAFNQAESTQFMQQSVSEMSVGIQQITTSAEHSAIEVANVLELARQGGDEMVATAKQMETIGNTVQLVKEQLDTLETNASHIQQVIELITNINKQMKILALNASVEAARAGIQGKGFLVIAKEISTLSLQTEQSSKDIHTFVHKIQMDLQLTRDCVFRSMTEAEQGGHAVNKAEQTFSKIQLEIKSNAENTNQVFSELQNIRTIAGQVVDHIVHIHSIAEAISGQTQEVSAATEEQLASMEELGHSANKLKDVAVDLELATEKFLI